MIININPERINIATSPARKALEQRRKQQQSESDSRIPTPRRAHENIIPSPESLSTLIRSAVAALRKGVRWDRGTILNLLT